MINAKGTVLARRQSDNSAEGFRALKVFWRQWRPRTWAIEGCNGVGKYLAQRLVVEGETVLGCLDPFHIVAVRREAPCTRRRVRDPPLWAVAAAR